MNDLIRRQDAIDALGEEPEVWSGNDEYAQGLNNQWHYDLIALKAVPSAQPEWIPISERLPEDEGWYLVTDDCAGWQWLEAVYCTPGDGIDPFWSVQNPIAWMPLPEPYKKGENDG